MKASLQQESLKEDEGCSGKLVVREAAKTL